jgi:hypothetical protein
VLRGEHATTLAAFEVDSLVWRTPAETEAWALAEPDVFSSPLTHLFRRPAIRAALGLPA